MTETKNYFEILNAINVSDKVEKKNGFSYLSWAWAWQVAKMHDPQTKQTVYETPEGRIYWHDNKTAWVKVGITMFGEEHIEHYPIIDYANKSIPVDKITSMNVNTSIQRAATKAIARHGLGLYIYAGEDLPEGEEDKKEEKKSEPVKYLTKDEMITKINSATTGIELTAIQRELQPSLNNLAKVNKADYDAVVLAGGKKRASV